MFMPGGDTIMDMTVHRLTLRLQHTLRQTPELPEN